MQRNQVCNHDQHQHQRNRDDMQREEAVQRGIGHDEVAADQDGQVRPDERHRREQVHDHLCAPEGHLSPRQQVTMKASPISIR